VFILVESDAEHSRAQAVPGLAPVAARATVARIARLRPCFWVPFVSGGLSEAAVCTVSSRPLTERRQRPSSPQMLHPQLDASTLRNLRSTAAQHPHLREYPPGLCRDAAPASNSILDTDAFHHKACHPFRCEICNENNPFCCPKLVPCILDTASPAVEG
jgi:hypothetical protein